MSALIFEYKCAACGASFRASGISDFSYGEFVLRTTSGAEAYLDAIRNETYKDVASLVEEHSLTKGKDEHFISDLVQYVFSVACDKDDLGNAYHFKLNPKCPQCGSLEMASWDVAEPVMESSIPTITTDSWDAFSEVTRLRLVTNELKKYL